MSDLTPGIALRLAQRLNELIDALERVVESPSWALRRKIADLYLHGEPLDPQ